MEIVVEQGTEKRKVHIRVWTRTPPANQLTNNARLPKRRRRLRLIPIAVRFRD